MLTGMSRWLLPILAAALVAALARDLIPQGTFSFKRPFRAEIALSTQMPIPSELLAEYYDRIDRIDRSDSRFQGLPSQLYPNHFTHFDNVTSQPGHGARNATIRLINETSEPVEAIRIRVGHAHWNQVITEDTATVDQNRSGFIEIPILKSNSIVAINIWSSSYNSFNTFEDQFGIMIQSASGKPQTILTAGPYHSGYNPRRWLWLEILPLILTMGLLIIASIAVPVFMSLREYSQIIKNPELYQLRRDEFLKQERIRKAKEIADKH